MNKILCTLCVTDEELGKLIKGYVDFDKIAHSKPNILNNPDYVREAVAHILSNIGITVSEDPNETACRSVRLECSDNNGTYYMLCSIAYNHELGVFVVSLGPLRKVVEDLDPFSAEEDLVLTPELVNTQNIAYMNACVLGSQNGKFVESIQPSTARLSH